MSSASAVDVPVATSSVREEFTRLAMDSSNRFRVKVKDGRLIEGTFSCIDSDENIILDNAVEYYGNLAVDAGKSANAMSLRLILNAFLFHCNFRFERCQHRAAKSWHDHDCGSTHHSGCRQQPRRCCLVAILKS